jgi:hypothetical protein
MFDLTAIVGTVASCVGLAVGLLQTIRLRELRRHTTSDVWLSIRTTGSILGKLETAPSYRNDPKVAEAYGKSIELFRHLLRQAALAERSYTEETIKRWRSAGKIHTDWQEAQARNFLATDFIDLHAERPGRRVDVSDSRSPDISTDTR